MFLALVVPTGFGSAQEERKWLDDDGDLLVIGSIVEVKGERVVIRRAGSDKGTVAAVMNKLSREDQKYVKAFIDGTLPKPDPTKKDRGIALQFVEYWAGINGQDLGKGYVETDIEIEGSRRDEVVMIKKPSGRKLVMARVEFRALKGDPQSLKRLIAQRKQIADIHPHFVASILIGNETVQKTTPSRFRFIDRALFEISDPRGNVHKPIWVARQDCKSILEVEGKVMLVGGNDTPPAIRTALRTTDSYTGLIKTSDTTTRLYLLCALPRHLDPEELEMTIQD